MLKEGRQPLLDAPSRYFFLRIEVYNCTFILSMILEDFQQYKNVPKMV